MTERWNEGRRARDEEHDEWANAPGRQSPDDPEFKGYRPNFEGAEHYRGPRQGGDPRDQSPDDPEFERTYRPNLDRGRDDRHPDWRGGFPPPPDEVDEWRRPGRFTGYGPRGYQRSDERIREDICERLTYYGELDARDIDLQVTAGEVTLTGSVADRREKRAAERIAETVSGVHDVHNQLRLRAYAFNRDNGGT